MQTYPSLILASNSPRRRQLLALGGWTFDVDVSNVDETRLPDEQPSDYVRRLAAEKARAVLARASDGQLIIGADTSVVIDGDVLGKPLDADEARQMLRRLRGRTHQVFTGIAVLRARDAQLWTDVVATDVLMRAYLDAEMEHYIASGDPLDKAGAYGIQNPDFQPVSSAGMQGCYASVMGLPLCTLSVLLRKAGLQTPREVPVGCQAVLNFTCPVFDAILSGGAQN